VVSLIVFLGIICTFLLCSADCNSDLRLVVTSLLAYMSNRLIFYLIHDSIRLMSKQSASKTPTYHCGCLVDQCFAQVFDALSVCASGFCSMH